MMIRQEQVNVMATYLAEGGAECDTVTYDEPTGACDGSQWTRHEWTCTPAMWAEARALALAASLDRP